MIMLIIATKIAKMAIKNVVCFFENTTIKSPHVSLYNINIKLYKGALIMIKDVLNIGELPLIIKNHSLGTIFYYNQDKKYILKQRATHYIKDTCKFIFD